MEEMWRRDDVWIINVNEKLCGRNVLIEGFSQFIYTLFLFVWQKHLWGLIFIIMAITACTCMKWKVCCQSRLLRHRHILLSMLLYHSTQVERGMCSDIKWLCLELYQHSLIDNYKMVSQEITFIETYFYNIFFSQEWA